MTATVGETTARVPPQNLDAEENVLGAIMLAPAAIEAAQEAGLRPEDFYRDSSGTIYRTACGMHDAGEPVDCVTLLREMERAGTLKSVPKGAERIRELAVGGMAIGNTAHYARIIVEMAAFRRLIEAGARIEGLGWGRQGQLPEVIASAEAELTKAVAPTSLDRAERFTDGLEAHLAEIRTAYTTKQAIFGESTGYRDLDAQLLGFWPGQLILLAARPGMGKSTLALNIAENFADRRDAVLFVSLEMSKYELRVRSLAKAAKINSLVLGTGQMKQEEAERLGKAIPLVMERTKLHIQDSGAATVASLRAEARRLKRQEDLKLIVVDYLQLMQGSGEANRNAEITTISRNLKLLARELHIPILALSQMNRDIERRAEKRPTLADLRDSGSLEQDADTVLFIHADSEYDPDKEDDGSVEVIVAKQRKGATGIVRLLYNRRYSSFYDQPIGGGA